MELWQTFGNAHKTQMLIAKSGKQLVQKLMEVNNIGFAYSSEIDSQKDISVDCNTNDQDAWCDHV